MSCIQRILAVKGDEEYLVFGGTAVEGGGNYRDYDYLITFGYLGFRCGYVAIPSDEDVPGIDFTSDYPELSVHCGLSYNEKPGIFDGLIKLIGAPVCDDRWIGFDAGNLGDKPNHEKALAIFTEKNGVAADIARHLNSEKESIYQQLLRTRGQIEVERTYDYMESECKRLIDQLIMHKEHHNMVGG